MANIQLADNLRRLRKQYNYTQATHRLRSAKSCISLIRLIQIMKPAYVNQTFNFLLNYPGSITPLSTRLSLSTAMQRIHHQLK